MKEIPKPCSFGLYMSTTRFNLKQRYRLNILSALTGGAMFLLVPYIFISLGFQKGLLFFLLIVSVIFYIALAIIVSRFIHGRLSRIGQIMFTDETIQVYIDKSEEIKYGGYYILVYRL